MILLVHKLLRSYMFILFLHQVEFRFWLIVIERLVVLEGSEWFVLFLI